jgi:hypothetical protein
MVLPKKTIYPRKTIWYAYHDENNMFELPVKFSFESINTEGDSMESFGEAITPGILLVNFFTGRSQQPSYEFYYPLVPPTLLRPSTSSSFLRRLGKTKRDCQ